MHLGRFRLDRITLVMLLFAARPLPAQSPSNSPVPAIPYSRLTLANGLTVIVHEDHAAPVVHVGVWYRVGSRDEPPGRTGFAHLFEHLMFGGSEHFRGDYLVGIRRLGLSFECGDTWLDRTRFCVSAPVGSLDAALWVEADRMGFLLGAVDQQRLDVTRGGVQSERRGRFEDGPYGNVALLTPPASYPPGHPYAHHPIGTQADLDAASLEDVRRWFRTYYTPNNAFLVLSGDVDSATARRKVERYFGGIAAGAPVARTTYWQAPLADDRREAVASRVPFPRVYRTWNTPGVTSADADYLLLAADILAGGPGSRLARLLVTERKVATDVAVDYEPLIGELSSQLSVNATARTQDVLAQIDSLVVAEVHRLAQEGPTAAELERARSAYLDRFVRSLERPGISGFGGRASVLAMAELYWRDPSAYRIHPTHIASVTPADIQRSVQRWLTRGAYVLEVTPAPVVRANVDSADRSRVPAVDETVVVPRLDLVRRTLSTGLTVVVVSRPSSPVVQLSLSVPAGFVYDPVERRGVAGVFVKLWGVQTLSRNADETRSALRAQNATLSTTLTEEQATLRMSALASNFTGAATLFADLAMDPSLDSASVAAAKRSMGATLTAERSTPFNVFGRVSTRLAYGVSHPYAASYGSGAGTDSSLSAITVADLATHVRERVTPSGATLVIVGGVSAATVDSLVDRVFGSWRGKAAAPRPVALASVQQRQTIYLVDAPGSAQSYVGAVAPLDKAVSPFDAATDAMVAVLGGDYSSRLNANLRLEKGWTYAARVELDGGEAQRYLVAFAGVRVDKTAESLTEMARELADIRGPRPVTVEELHAVQRSRTASFANRWTSTANVAADVQTIAENHLPPDYYRRFAEAYAALTPEAVTRAAASIIQPSTLVWFVVGDRTRIEPALRALARGDVQIIDSDARSVPLDRSK